MISLSLRSKLLRQFSGATTPPGLRGGGAKCFQARRVEMDHPSGCHDDGDDGGDDGDDGGDDGGDGGVVDCLRGADVSAGVDDKYDDDKSYDDCCECDGDGFHKISPTLSVF